MLDFFYGKECNMRKNKKYSAALKRQVVEEYLSGAGMYELVRKHGLSDKTRIQDWLKKYLEYGCFPDGRGKSSSGGRPRKIDVSQMTKDEYIAYLEMENTILKHLCSLSNSPQKSNIEL